MKDVYWTTPAVLQDLGFSVSSEGLPFRWLAHSKKFWGSSSLDTVYVELRDYILTCSLHNSRWWWRQSTVQSVWLFPVFYLKYTKNTHIACIIIHVLDSLKRRISDKCIALRCKLEIRQFKTSDFKLTCYKDHKLNHLAYQNLHVR